MPLKLQPPRPKNPNWQIRGTYLGRHVDQSSRTSKRAIAVKVLKQIEQQIERGEFAKPGEPTFANAALDYMNAGGERTYIKKLLEHFGDTPLSQVNQAAIDSAAAALYPGATGATRNRSVYTPTSAILRRAGISLGLRRPRGAAGNKQTAWLWPEQAEAIFAEAGKIDQEFAALLIVLCYTGMRLGEALGLTWARVNLQERHAYLPDTKSGVPRTVYLPPVAISALANQPQDRGRVFRFHKSGYLYSLLHKAGTAANVTLPARSAFHIFRHTFATWMRLYAKADETALIATGAWKDKKSVARYTHSIIHEDARLAELLPTRRRG